MGKSRPINAAHGFLRTLDDFKFGATSMTMASLVDHMAEAKRIIIQLPDDPLEYHTLTIVADELSAFMHEYDNGLIAGLTKFYDCSEYSQGRRVGDIRIKIERPQLTILSGSTPSNLIHFLPDWAWEQGFTSRVFLIYANERPVIDVFATEFRPMPRDMEHDLEVISKLTGQFGWSEEWARAMHDWKLNKFSVEIEGRVFGPPGHPKLKHYCSRRFAHMIKLSMISSVDRGNSLTLEKEDFNRALSWLIEAELEMPKIFEIGAGSEDNKAIEEILHYIRASGEVSEARIVNFARSRVRYAANIPRVIAVMEQGGMIVHSSNDRMGLKLFKAAQGS